MGSDGEFEFRRQELVFCKLASLYLAFEADGALSGARAHVREELGRSV